MDESNDHAMSSPSTNDITADLSSAVDRVKDLPMMQVPVGDLYTGAAMTSGTNGFIGATQANPLKVLTRSGVVLLSCLPTE